MQIKLTALAPLAGGQQRSLQLLDETVTKTVVGSGEARGGGGGVPGAAGSVPVPGPKACATFCTKPPHDERLVLMANSRELKFRVSARVHVAM